MYFFTSKFQGISPVSFTRALFLTVRYEIAEPLRKTGARSLRPESYSNSAVGPRGEPQAEGAPEQRIGDCSRMFMNKAGRTVTHENDREPYPKNLTGPPSPP